VRKQYRLLYTSFIQRIITKFFTVESTNRLKFCTDSNYNLGKKHYRERKRLSGINRFLVDVNTFKKHHIVMLKDKYNDSKLV
jgi:hypothetical protein